MIKRPAGFTLVEVVISTFVGMIILAAIYAAVATGQRSAANMERKVVAGQDARAALELMALEIQMASYNPNLTPGMWIVPTGDCDAVSGNQNYKGIQAATDSSISIEADINEINGVAKIGTPNENPNEIITYNYNADADKQYITRSTSCGSAFAFLGETVASGKPRSVRVINTTDIPVFQYFDARGVRILTGTTTDTLPAAIPNIARIDITLWVETEDVDSNTGQRRRMVYATSVIPRNHVIR